MRAAVSRPPGAASTTWARPRPAIRPAAACRSRPSHTTSHAGTQSLPRQPCHLTVTAQETLTSPDRSGDRLRHAQHEDTKLGATQHIGAVMSVADFSDCGILSHVMSHCPRSRRLHSRLSIARGNTNLHRRLAHPGRCRACRRPPACASRAPPACMTRGCPASADARATTHEYTAQPARCTQSMYNLLATHVKA